MASFHVKKGQMHRDLGKPQGAPITESDISKERAKGGVFAKRANFAQEAKEGVFQHHHERGHMARQAQKAMGR